MANRFWVGGNGTWDNADTTHWSDTSNGAGGQSVPGSSDTVTFDASSGGGAITLNYSPSVISITGGAHTGTFDTGNNNITVQTFSYTGTGARTLTLGSSTITVTGSGATILDFTVITSLTLTANTATFDCTYANGTGTRTIVTGAITEASSFNVKVSAGTDALSITAASVFKDLNLTGYAGTKSNTTTTLYGSLTINGGTFTAGANAITFGSTSATVRTITSSVALDFPITLSGVGGTFNLGGDLTIGSGTSLRIFTLTNGTFDINGHNFTTTQFWSNNSNIRTIKDGAGGGTITITQNNTTIWDTGTATNLTMSNLPTIVFNYAGSTGTRTINSLSAAGVENQAISVSISGAGTVAFSAGSKFKNVDFTSFTGTKSNTTSTIYGDLTVVGGTFTGGTSAITFAGTGTTTSTINSAITLDFPITVNELGKTLKLGANLTLGTARALTVTNGTFTCINGASTYILSIGGFTIGAGAIFTLGDVTHIINGAVLCLTDATSIINCGVGTLKWTDTSGTTTGLSAPTRTFYNIWIARGASTGMFVVGDGGLTLNDLKDDGTGTHTIRFSVNGLIVLNTMTISGTVGHLISLISNTAGTRSYVIRTSGTNTSDYLSITDVQVGGGATWVAGANTTWVSNFDGWSDQPALTNRYWVAGGTGNWNSTTNWSTTDGGGSGASIPNSNNDVFFNGNSGSGVATVNAAFLLKNVSFSGFTGTLAGSSALTIYGNLTFGSGMTVTYTGAIIYGNNLSSKTITSGTKTFGGAVTLGIAINSPYIIDSWTLSGDFVAAGAVILNSGTFDAANYNFQSTTFASNNSNLRTLSMGSGNWILTASGTAWALAPVNLTFNPSTSTIKMTDTSTTTITFQGGAQTYYNVWFARGTSTAINQFSASYSQIFNDIKDTGTVAHSLLFGSATLTKFKTFTVTGTAGNLITVGSTSAGVVSFLEKIDGQIISTDYLLVKDSSISVAFAGANSTNGGNNTGWVFLAPSAVSGNVKNGGVNVSGAKLRLIDETLNKEVANTVSDGSGNYSFYADVSKKYHVCVEYTDGGSVKYNAKSLWEIAPV